MIGLLPEDASGVALLEPARGLELGHRELRRRVEDAAEALARAAGGRALVFLVMGNDVDAVVLYLAALAASLPVVLTEPHALERLIERYRPTLLVGPESAPAPPGYRRLESTAAAPGYRIDRAESPSPIALHPDLAVMLSTSGSTGNPKLVRLTRRNLEANARSIAEYLGLGAGERAIQSLPSHYSYGLSVLDSHLLAGGSVALTPHSFMRPEFWSAFDAAGCTSFAGVPYMYETLHRLRFAPARHRGLRTMTQAGGALRLDLTRHFHGLAAEARVRFFVMYGQTEATARIAYVPPERLHEKIGSIGVPIPQGRLSLAPVEGLEAEELVYEGPNVMMGYAEGPDDLGLGDVQQGRLATGDLGRVDGDGFFSVVGRLKRFAKLFGRRVSLEDVEHEVESVFGARAAALDGGDRVILHVIADHAGLEPIAGHVARYLAVPPKAIVVHRLDAMPLTAAGKKDYQALARGERIGS